MREEPADGPGETAAAYVPDRLTLAALRRSAAGCRGCRLWKHGTQTVFGEGLRRARLMLFGEQPGHEEDLSARPFDGPSGRELDRALDRAGIVRDDAYVTNVVKHFKWEPRGKRRLHKKPNAREIGACLPWLDAEIEVVQPEVLMLLGATASQALLGSGFRVTRDRGRFLASDRAPWVIASIHPSAILRMRTEREREHAREDFVQDLRRVADVLDDGGARTASNGRPAAP